MYGDAWCGVVWCATAVSSRKSSETMHRPKATLDFRVYSVFMGAMSMPVRPAQRGGLRAS
jgi:hypothetical protein